MVNIKQNDLILIGAGAIFLLWVSKGKITESVGYGLGAGGGNLVTGTLRGLSDTLIKKPMESLVNQSKWNNDFYKSGGQKFYI